MQNSQRTGARCPNPKSDYAFPLVAYALAAFAASLLFTGYKVYFHNQSLQLPLVHLLNNPKLYPNDPFAATFPYYACVVWWLVAWGTRIVGLEPLLLCLFLAERFLVIFAAGNLARTLAPTSRLAAIGSMAFFALLPQPILGGGTLVMPYFEQTSLTIAFLLLAMSAFHKTRPIWWAISLAAAFSCNSLYGCYALTYFGAALLLDENYRKQWPRWAAALGLFLVLSLPAVYMAAGAYAKSTVDNELWVTASRVRIPHHIFPTLWPAERFVRFAALPIILVLCARQDGERSRKLLRHSLIWGGVAVAWVLLAFAAELARSPSLMILQAARATDVWYCFAAIALISVCARKSEESIDVRSLLAAIFFIWVIFWHPGAIWITSAAVVLFAMAQWSAWTRALGGITRSGMLILLALAVAGVAAFGVRASNKGIRQALLWRPGLSKELVAKWASANTTLDTTFLVNPNWGDFRALSKRPVFVTWKDGSALLWYRSFVREWVDRVRELGYDVTRNKPPGTTISARLDKLYLGLGDEYVKALASRYRIRYWVVPVGKHSGLPVAFEDRLYKVLDLQSSRSIRSQTQ